VVDSHRIELTSDAHGSARHLKGCEGHVAQKLKGCMESMRELRELGAHLICRVADCGDWLRSAIMRRPQL
jgi:hypothetical protein